MTGLLQCMTILPRTAVTVMGNITCHRYGHRHGHNITIEQSVCKYILLQQRNPLGATLGHPTSNAENTPSRLRKGSMAKKKEYPHCHLLHTVQRRVRPKLDRLLVAANSSPEANSSQIPDNIPNNRDSSPKRAKASNQQGIPLLNHRS